MRRLLLVCALLFCLPVLAEEAKTTKTEKPKIKYRCWPKQRQYASPTKVTVLVRCHSMNLEKESTVPEWRLFGSDEDMLTDFIQDFGFEFIAPDKWRLLEMSYYVGERKSRFRVWVRGGNDGSVESREYGREIE